MANSLKIPFLDLARVNEPMRHDLQRAASRVIDSGWYLHGPETDAFERELAQLCAADGCVAVSNGLDALRLILKSYMQLGRLKPGDEVLVPANTYIATILAITDAGLTPMLIEPDPLTLNMDLDLIEQKISSRTRAIMVVHLYGRPCWSEHIRQVAEGLNLLVIEDNAQAIGAQTASVGISGRSKMTGALGHAAAFSFYPTKNIGALGDAGAVTSCDPELLAAVRARANYGSDRRYHNIYAGYNCRMDELQAAMLRVKLQHLDREIEHRNSIAKIYGSEIKRENMILPSPVPEGVHVWHQYVVLTAERERLQQYLKEKGIGTDIHYAVPPHKQPCYIDTLGRTQYPVTEMLAHMVLSLPIGSVTPAEAHEVAAAISEF